MPIAEYNERLTITLTKVELEKLKKLAKKRGLTLTQLIVYDLRDKGTI